MSRFKLVILPLIFCTPLWAQAAGSMQINFDTQRAGGDYRTLYLDNYQDCARQCEASSRCVAFDFHTDHSCWLKNYAYSPRYYRGAVSGVKRSSSPGSSAGRPYSGNRYRLILTAQQILTEQGYRPGYVDGQMGYKTREALRNYQYDNGLTPTGELDPPTLEAMGLIVRPKAQTQEQEQPQMQNQQTQPQTDMEQEQQNSQDGTTEDSFDTTDPEAKG